MYRNKASRISAYGIFSAANYTFMAMMALLCIVPMIHLLAVSFSAPHFANGGNVVLVPRGFTTAAYNVVTKNAAFWAAMRVSVLRILVGGGLSMVLTITAAYPLSIDTKLFPARKYYVWMIFFTMIFSGGLVPTFLVVYYTGLMDSIWALTVPGAVSAWNIILVLNFFRQLPKELKEAAFIDGAGHIRILFSVVLPLSKPVLATVGLFIVVGHWNSWFDGMLYMRRPNNYPLQTYLQSMLSVDVTKFLSTETQRIMNQVSTKTVQAAQIFLGALPILCIYPLLQKYFAKGLVLGSVKE